MPEIAHLAAQDAVITLWWAAETAYIFVTGLLVAELIARVSRRWSR